MATLNTVKDLFANPKHTPGKKTAEAFARSPLVVKANRITDDAFSGDATQQVFNVPANTLILDMLVEVVGAFGGGPSFTLGDGVDPDRFMDNAAIGGNTTGFKHMQSDGQPGSVGYEYTSADTIDLIQTGTPTQGTMDIWLTYLPALPKWGLT